VPLDVTIDTIQLTSIPYYRSGDLLKFPLHYAHAAAMELVSAADHKPIPAGAIAYFKNANFVVGNEGRLYITDLAENKSNQFVVKWDDSSCTAKVNYQTQPNTPIANLGRIICE
jgi:outer membrane usher protein